MKILLAPIVENEESQGSLAVPPQSVANQQLVVALSFSNLLHTRVWSSLLGSVLVPSAFTRAPATRAQLFSAMLSVLLMAALIFGLLRLARSTRNGVSISARGALLVLGLWTINGLRTTFSPYIPYLRSGAWSGLSRGSMATVTLLAAGGLFAAWHFRRSLCPFLSAVLLITSPAIALTFGQAAWAATVSDSKYLDRPLAHSLSNTSQHAARVVWIVFDELDRALTFDTRPKSLRLPELDMMRQQAVSASSAFSPAGSTVPSMISALTGRPVTAVNDLGTQRIEVRFKDGDQNSSWARDNVFSDVRALGYNTGAVGWHLPYCRVLNDALTQCWWDALPSVTNSTDGTGLAQGVRDILRTNLEGASFGLARPSLIMEGFAKMYQASTAHAAAMAIDGNLGLVLLHLPGAHAPYVYSRNSGKFDRTFSLPSGYPDGLALVDRTFGELHRAMVVAGEWDRTTVILTSDHWFRDADKLTGKIDKRVPFLVKLAGQNKPIPYPRSFNTLITRDLILALLRREITSPDDLVAWLDRGQVELSARH